MTMGLAALRARFAGGDHAEWWAEVEAAAAASGRPLGITRHLLDHIDWSAPEACVLRRQFLPMISELEPDHPLCREDPLAEAADQLAPGLVRRYPDRALLLATDSCPVYCAYCTRSWAVGSGAEALRRAAWMRALEALQQRPEVVDVTVSGGDVWQIPPAELAWLADALLALPTLERLRLATRGLVADPQRSAGGSALLEALSAIGALAKERGVRFAVHLQVNHARELTTAARSATRRVRQLGVEIRSQTVLLRGVNDSTGALLELVAALVGCGVQPYYVYTADLVPGAEHLRTNLARALELEKQLRGRTAGFDTPTFVCDVLGGGGKRGVHSYEHYDRSSGLAVFRSPVVAPEGLFLHADPLRELEPELRAAWQDPDGREAIIAASLARVRCRASLC